MVPGPEGDADPEQLRGRHLREREPEIDAEGNGFKGSFTQTFSESHDSNTEALKEANALLVKQRLHNSRAGPGFS